MKKFHTHLLPLLAAAAATVLTSSGLSTSELDVLANDRFIGQVSTANPQQQLRLAREAVRTRLLFRSTGRASTTTQLVVHWKPGRGYSA